MLDNVLARTDSGALPLPEPEETSLFGAVAGAPQVVWRALSSGADR